MSTQEWWILIAVCLAAAALMVAVLALRSTGARSRSLSPANKPSSIVADADSRGSGELYAFVVNPSKPLSGEIRGPLLAAIEARGLPEPLWFETTADEPGAAAARSALAQGADVVVAVGGDGTVRAVADALAKSGKTMGLMPLGTGNLLARNLDIDVSNLDAALQVVLGVDTRTIDVGRVRLDGGDPHTFLVIGGIGFDAAMVADTDTSLKAKVGWIAYFVSGIRHLHSRRTSMEITIDDSREFHTRLRSLLIGNCGRLPGGLTLLPDAEIDDGILDIAAIDTRGGVAGWVQLFGEVVMQGMGVRNDLPNKIGRIDHTTGAQIEVHIEDAPQQVQVDGDLIGPARDVSAWVEPGALLIRAPLPRLPRGR